MWEYTDELKEHFFNPRNVGEVENPDGVGEVGSLACGDALKLTFKLDENGRIKDAQFKTFGCASAIATSSVLTEMIKGKTLEEAAKVTNKDIADYLGGLPEQKMHCSVMGREALEAAIENYRSGGKKKHELEGRVVCNCFGVTENEIERVIKENNLTTVEEVTNYCKAGGGCGGCQGDIEKIIEKIQGDKIEELPAAAPRRPGKLTNIQKIQLIQQTINEQIRPALRAHGGNIELIDVEDDKVIVAFRGMCSQCMLAEYTMKDLVQAKLKEFVSDTLFVEEDKDSASEPHEHRG
ncbi:MAG: Fe-S cluster assembly protein NifU [Phycisphaerae bacterium]|nr:Fe-S cluster assembly protein NifU [Phycisphaerae bacterium]NIP53433.1 Fe-S cluster assembly protein NifU [Phycisphaerae bacterium]NIS52683.1 Fe-S cluster assembly protein NifU [Phycisphaerae bacterium]NIU09925.1 Fe-S cluster assembly protein NifU [Phycisphaerae bacterium]NIU57663.1 Fe-S cluster assembly protein NifU [Phycisphaerae bacterium]